MIHFLNRSLLFRDTNAVAAALLRSRLTAAGIPFKTKTEAPGAATPAVRFPRVGKTGSMGPVMGPYMAGGVPHAWVEGPAPGTVHSIYVRRRDFNRAKALRDGKA
jgi:hypothetical protein